MQFETGRVELITGCASFVFVGGWEADANGQVVLPGFLESLSSGNKVPAKLQLQFSGSMEAGSSVTVTVLDESGHPLIGPHAVVPVTSIHVRTPALDCPS